MNSLKNYKDQVYNIGSPSPTPSIKPLENLPNSSQADFDFSGSPPLKTKPTRSKIPKVSSDISTSKKRKHSSKSVDKTESPCKKLKMISEEQFKEYIRVADEKAEQAKKDTADQLAGILSKFENRIDNLAKDSDDNLTKGLSKFERRMDGLASKLDKVIQDNTEANNEIKDELVNMKDQVSVLQNSVDNQRSKFEDKLVQLEGNFNLLSESVLSASTKAAEELKEALVPIVKDEVIEVVKKEVKEDVLPPVMATWNAIQAQKVWEHEHAMLVLGFESAKSPMESATDLLKNELKMSEENCLKIAVKRSVRLGKSEGGKIAPLLITFGHPSERNLALNHSKNLKNKKISLKKSVPENYRDEYKKFEDISFRLRNMPDLDYQVQIVFDGHLMLLRTKLKDTTEVKYHYTTYRTFQPPMVTVSDQKSSLKTPKGTKASPTPDTSTMSKANSSIFMSVKGMTEELTEDTFKREILSYLKEEHRSMIIDFKMKKKGLGIIYCDSWNSAKIIATKYTDKFMNYTVSFTMFCDENPDVMQQ